MFAFSAGKHSPNKSLTAGRLVGETSSGLTSFDQYENSSLRPYTSLWNILNVVRLTEDWKEVVAWLVSV